MKKLAARLSSVYGEMVEIMGPYRCKDGRLRVDVKTASKTTTCQLARIILEVKIGRKLIDNETVDHIDEDFTNDHPSNLQVLTRGENSSKSQKISSNLPSDTSGEKNGMAELTDGKVLAILKKHKSDTAKGRARTVTTKTLAQEFDVKQTTIKAITSRKRWKHLMV